MISVITGSNVLAKQEQLESLKRDFIEKHGSDGLEQYIGEALEPQALRGMLTGASLFANHRLIIVRNFSAQSALSEALLECLSAIPDEVHLVLIEDQFDKRTTLYKTLKKTATIHELDELDAFTLTKWVKQYVAAHGGTIDGRTAEVLVGSVGADQLRLKNEIEKLLLYDLHITQAGIDELIEKTPQETVFSLLDATLAGKVEQALTILETMERAHEDVFQLVNMLIWQVHIVAVLHAGLKKTDSEIAKAAKINPFVVKKSRSLAHKLSRTELRKIIGIVADCDVTLKTTSTDPWRVLEQTILALEV